jgi:hypothetical protein
VKDGNHIFGVLSPEIETENSHDDNLLRIIRSEPKSHQLVIGDSDEFSRFYTIAGDRL